MQTSSLPDPSNSRLGGGVKVVGRCTHVGATGAGVLKRQFLLCVLPQDVLVGILRLVVLGPGWCSMPVAHNHDWMLKVRLCDLIQPKCDGGVVQNELETLCNVEWLVWMSKMHAMKQ